MNAALAEASHYHDVGAKGFFAVRAYGSQTLHIMADLSRVLNIQPVPPDLQISQAEYRSPRNRRTTNVLRVGLCFVDCDLHKSRYKDLAPEQAAQVLLWHCEETGLPKPCLIIFSGRGLHVKWIFDAPIPACALTRWGFVQKEFGKRLADFGADMGALDASRCLRAVGTVNIKSGETARVLYQHNYHYDFDELANLLLPYTREQVAAFRQDVEEKQEQRAARETRPQAVHATSNLWTIPDLYCRHIEDIRTLCELRGWKNGVPDGERGNVLYVATICCHWAHNPANLEAEAQELARQLCPSLTPADVRGRVCSVVAKSKTDKPFTLRTQTILETLHITPAEQQKLRTLCGADIRKERKQDRDRQAHRKHSDRETYEANAIQRRAPEVKALREQGHSYRAIAEQTGLTIKQVDNLLNRKPPYTQ